MRCAATKRISIRWLPGDPYEDTDTLVLSVDNYYIDVRVKQDHKTIDWGFAGTKRIEDDGRNVWTHAIDSRHCLDEDSGYVRMLDNGDELESGIMLNPDQNVMMRHEEVWRPLQLSKDMGFVMTHISGNCYAAMVDGHFLMVAVEDLVATVARYTEGAVSGAWQKDFVIGPAHAARHINSLFIQNLLHNDEWIVLAQAGMSV